MPLILDQISRELPPNLSPDSTIGDCLKWATSLLPKGRVIVSIQLDGKILEGPGLSHAKRDTLGQVSLEMVSADQKELALTMLGKLAALIEWLSPQHAQVALMLEQGNTQQGLERLQGIVSAWQQIQAAYGNLAKLLALDLKTLPVHDLNGEAVLNEFCERLGEIENALNNQDFVLLADILQYEMEGAIANWMALLEATLGVVESETPVAAA
jgi:hypothetical protein